MQKVSLFTAMKVLNCISNSLGESLGPLFRGNTTIALQIISPIIVVSVPLNIHKQRLKVGFCERKDKMMQLCGHNCRITDYMHKTHYTNTQRTYPMLYKMDRKPDWKVVLNILGSLTLGPSEEQGCYL